MEHPYLMPRALSFHTTLHELLQSPLQNRQCHILEFLVVLHYWRSQINTRIVAEPGALDQFHKSPGALFILVRSPGALTSLEPCLSLLLFS